MSTVLCQVDWDAVIDAEVRRRKQLEVNPEATTSTEPVRFTPSQIPWWAWMKRFHLPEAELVNGRAAMVGFAAAYLIDALSGESKGCSAMVLCSAISVGMGEWTQAPGS